MPPDDHVPEATDGWARTLLRRAAETVEVDPAGPLDLPPPRQLWPLLVAAAAVVAIAVATAVVTLGGGSTPPVSTPHDDGHFRLGPDQVPSVFGYDRESALHLLTDRGLRVTVVEDDTCQETAGRALWSEPGAGWIFHPGDEVQLVVGSASSRCPQHRDRSTAWQFIDFANGRPSTARFAETVTLYSANGGTRTLTSADLHEPDSWQVCATDGDCLSPTGLVLDAQARVEAVLGKGVRFSTPSLRVNPALGIPCTDRMPEALAGRHGLTLTVEIPSDSMGFTTLCRGVTLYQNDAGEVDAVAVGDSTDGGYTLVPPTVVGMSITGARERLEADGYTVAEIPRHDCAQPGIVTVQAPEPGVEETTSTNVVSLGVVDRRTRCNSNRFLTTPAQLAGDALRDFARGHQTAPPFAAEVGVYVGNKLQTTLSAAQAQDPANWDTCPTYADRLCPLSPLRQLAEAGRVVYSRPPPDGTCLVRLQDLPPELEASLGDSTRMDQPEARDCHDMWAVQVWVDHSGAISAVNLLLGPALNAG